MSRRSIPMIVVTVLAATTVRCDGEQGPICDAAALRRALEVARPGTTVRLGACQIRGSFTVPAGVTLAGEELGRSVLVSETRRSALRLVPGTPPTQATDLSVESAANAGVLVLAGEGGAILERVRVSATRGIALAAQDVGSLRLNHVTLMGPVTPENAPQSSHLPDETATHGMVLIRVGNAALTNVTSTRFALFGALIVDSTTSWTGGGAPRNVGVGLMVYRGVARLGNLDLTGTLDGDRGMAAYGAVFAGDATSAAQITSARLDVSHGEDFGMLHQHATVVHQDLVVEGNGWAGIWAQNCRSFEIAGAAIRRNRLGGIVAMQVARMVVANASVDATRLASVTVGQGGSDEVGDGIHIVMGDGRVQLRDLTLGGNERVGLLLELQGGTTDRVTIENVTVTGTGEQLGAVAQGGTVLPGWDRGITREGATAANDANLGDRRLTHLSVFPEHDFPSAARSLEDLLAPLPLDPPE